MSANMIYVDDVSLATDMLFHPATPSMQSYLGNTLNSYVNEVKVLAPQYAADLKKLYNDFANSSAVAHMNNLKNRIASIWKTDTVRALVTVEDIQQAPDTMKRWVMAYPQLREIYQMGGLSAYDKTYEDKYPDTIGKQHYDYRRATDGIIMLDKETNEVGYSNYYEGGIVEEDVLTLMQKAGILLTWDMISAHIDSGDSADITSVWNETM